MAPSIWELQAGEQITLDQEVVAEVVAPTEDGVWIRVKYIHAPESPDIVWTEDICNTEEILSGGNTEEILGPQHFGGVYCRNSAF